MGAVDMGVPGWPALAFCTASMARVRMVSMLGFCRSFPGISVSPYSLAARGVAWALQQVNLLLGKGVTCCHAHSPIAGPLAPPLGKNRRAWCINDAYKSISTENYPLECLK